YKFRDLTVEELTKVNMLYPNFRFSMDTYVFKDSSQKDLLNFTGTIPVNYQGISDMNSKNQEKSVNKITVVGSGELGIACVLAILAKGVADKVVLIDFSEGTKGGAMDIDIFELQNVEISKVEIMTYAAWKLSAFPENQVIGIGCNLDSKRFQYILTNVLKAQSSGNEMWIIGEQGEDKGIL
uniref:UEV and lactate/malate dehyrogenase domains n=1 Tax=Monodelphis domestica TaxID=13616 RepID=A0A5F8HC36_MONDO